MRTGILADVHGNAVALEAVLRDGEKAGVERWMALGDIVGYGPEPERCLEQLRRLGAASVMGNHEARTLGLPTGPFNALADEAIAFTREALSAQSRAQIEGFATQLHDDGVLYCHGSPNDRDEYLFLRIQLDEIVRAAPAPVVFFGHTHQQLAFDGARWIRHAEEIPLEPGRRWLVNPGSVGQPRDGDPRAGFAILDTGRKRLQLRRVEYDVEEQVARVQRSGLPVYLGERLREGH